MTVVKCVLVGDNECKKTTLLQTYVTNAFPGEYCPTVVDNCSSHKHIDGKLVTLGLWDTAGQEDYDRLRPLSYPSTDVFVICFCTYSRKSLYNVIYKWYAELFHHAPSVPAILVGVNTTGADSDEDVPHDRLQHPISDHEGSIVAAAIGAKYYHYCCPLTQEGISLVFDNATRVGMDKSSTKSRSIFHRISSSLFSSTSPTESLVSDSLASLRKDAQSIREEQDRIIRHEEIQKRQAAVQALQKQFADEDASAANLLRSSESESESGSKSSELEQSTEEKDPKLDKQAIRKARLEAAGRKKYWFPWLASQKTAILMLQQYNTAWEGQF